MINLFNSWRINREVTRTEKQEEAFVAVSLDAIKEKLAGSDDVGYKEIKIGGEILTLCFVQGLVNIELVDNVILRPIINQTQINKAIRVIDIYKDIENGLIYHASYKAAADLNECIDSILTGELFLIGKSENKGFLFEVKGFEKRGIQEPSDENVIKGSKDSFIEVLRINTALVRRKIKTKDLKIEEVEVGEHGKTKIAIMYLNNIVDKELLNDVKAKVKQIKVDNLIFPADFDEQFVEKRNTIFPQILYTERPDRLCANINDGKIGIIIDGLPIAYVVPAVFTMFLQAPEDYSFNVIITSFLRILRYVCLILAIFLPAIYIAIVTFQKEMIPADLAMSIMKSKEGVPFTAFLETLFMLIAFEILTEAGIRLPKVIGQTASVVGGLIVGQAAVQAKIVSPAAVIVIAISAISGFILPSQDLNNSVRICRIIMFILANLAGLFGLSIGVIILLYHLCSIKVFDIPYMIPYSSNEGKALLKDTIIRPIMSGKKGG